MLKISYAELCLNGEIITCNTNFKNMFSWGMPAEVYNNFYELLEAPQSTELRSVLDKLVVGESYNFLLITNTSKQLKNRSKNAIMITYACIYKQHKQKLNLYVTNYLSWLHNVSNAKNLIYNCFVQLNKLFQKDIFASISHINAFKALHPLFISPKSYVGKLYANSMLDTAKIFFKNKEPTRPNDYVANVLGSITKDMNTDLETYYLDWQEGILNNEYNIKYEDEYYIPDTQLKQNYVMSVSEDSFLNSILKTY